MTRGAHAASASAPLGASAYSTIVSGYAPGAVVATSGASIPSDCGFIVGTAAASDSGVGRTNWPAAFSIDTGVIPSRVAVARSVSTHCGPGSKALKPCSNRYTDRSISELSDTRLRAPLRPKGTSARPRLASTPRGAPPAAALPFQASGASVSAYWVMTSEMALVDDSARGALAVVAVL